MELPVPAPDRVEAGHVLLLGTPGSYRLRPFLDAAAQLGVRASTAVDMPWELAADGRHGRGFPFAEVETCVDLIGDLHLTLPLNAILAVDDSGSLLAAAASLELGLPHNSPEAALAASNKYRMRRVLAEGGLNCPRFRLVTADMDPLDAAANVGFPLIIKPLEANGSQGVMRIDNQEELPKAVARLAAIIGGDPGQLRPDFLMESYIPGVEVAVEALAHGSSLTVLAIFDKPDPLEGPFFEETIYVTPSRMAVDAQEAVHRSTQQAAAALGLGFGPIHAEMRINDEGVWILELAGRSIGGLCSRTLRFDAGVSLEALILQQACSLPLSLHRNRDTAQGVMMIPIPESGILCAVDGVCKAEAVDFVNDVEITALPGTSLQALPEGNSYLGFIFANGPDPEPVEQALRDAHACLDIRIEPEIPLAVG